MLLMQAQENEVALDEKQLLFIARGQDNAINEDVDEQPVQGLALNVDNVFQADGCELLILMLMRLLRQNYVMANLYRTSCFMMDMVRLLILEFYLEVKIAHLISRKRLFSNLHTTEAINPEQIFWSQDLIKMKEEALKKQTTTSRPIKALMVYPPNTPATLNKGETIHDYYVWFAKLINDMQNIKMTMSRMQLNLKFVNNMFPEWGRFVTTLKLNRGLRDSNNDQLTSSNTRNQAIVQDGQVVVQNVQGRQNKGQGNNARGHLARNCTQTKRPQNSEYFKDKMLLMQAQENRVALDEEQLLFIAGGQDNAVDEDVDEQPIQDLALNVDNVFQADDCDAFDSDVDEAPTAQTIFMENLSSAYPVYDEASPSYD
ncbi:hypothetical protein Tco_1563839 [Tanacetum coccineum]